MHHVCFLSVNVVPSHIQLGCDTLPLASLMRSCEIGPVLSSDNVLAAPRSKLVPCVVAASPVTWCFPIQVPAPRTVPNTLHPIGHPPACLVARGPPTAIARFGLVDSHMWLPVRISAGEPQNPSKVPASPRLRVSVSASLLASEPLESFEGFLFEQPVI